MEDHETEVAEMFQRGFLTNQRVDTVLHSVQMVETDTVGTRGFMELLKPSPTVHEALGYVGNKVGCGNVHLEVKGRTLKAVIARLDVVMRGFDGKAGMAKRLKEFEVEVGIPKVGHGGLERLLMTPGVTVDAVVMFLSNYFDAVEPSRSGSK